MKNCKGFHPLRAFRRGACPMVIGGLVLAFLSGCAYYSFTGASLPPHLNSIAIPLVENNSAIPFTGVEDQLTQLLQERFVGQTRLSLETDEAEADAVLTGRIDRYTNQPAAVGGQEQATLNRVSITVAVRYVDQVEDRELLARTFTGSAEYDPLAEGIQGEQTAAFAALDNIADDIFTAATSNW